MTQPESWFYFLVADRVAQSMLMVLMFALVLVGIGTYGFGRSVVGHRVAPLEQHLANGSEDRTARLRPHAGPM